MPLSRLEIYTKKPANTNVYRLFQTPRVGLEPTTTRLTAARSTDWAIEDYSSPCLLYLMQGFPSLFLPVPSKLHTDSFQTPPPSFSWLSPRPISDSQLHMLPCFHPCPIYLIVSKGSYRIPPGISHLKGGFTLRCLQRLSLPNLATLPCRWCDNR